METPNLLKGYLYQSSRVVRCPRFHACTVTHKCQNYDRHQLDCSICESRVRPPVSLGGILPEGEFVPDLQDAMKIIQINVLRRLAHPDNEGQKMESLYDVSYKMDRIRKAQEIMGMFQTTGVMTMDEQIERCLMDSSLAERLGRLV